jgi:hypothetical protein
MDTKSSLWKAARKSEKFSIVALTVCILVLMAILLVRPF